MYRITNQQRRYHVNVFLSSETAKPDQFIVSEPFQVQLFDGRVVTIPRGFVSDGHSTPRLLDVLLPHFDSKTNLAALVHDYLYMQWEDYLSSMGEAQGVFLTRLKAYQDTERAYADEAYHYLMEQMAPGRFRNGLYWVAVRLFGGRNWQRFRQAAQKNRV